MKYTQKNDTGGIFFETPQQGEGRRVRDETSSAQLLMLRGRFCALLSRSSSHLHLITSTVKSDSKKTGWASREEHTEAGRGQASLGPGPEHCLDGALGGTLHCLRFLMSQHTGLVRARRGNPTHLHKQPALAVITRTSTSNPGVNQCGKAGRGRLVLRTVLGAGKYTHAKFLSLHSLPHLLARQARRTQGTEAEGATQW